jgi:hypothetical protein
MHFIVTFAKIDDKIKNIYGRNLMSNKHNETNIITNKYELERMWIRAKNACRTTVNKKHTEIEPKDSFKIKLLLSEHSPIRLIRVGWIWDKIKSWVSTHFSRSKWECFISTQRTDRTGVDRDELKQNELVSFEGEMNAQNLIDTSRKRLCYQSSDETREYTESLKCTINDIDKTLAFVMVPNCVYRCGCPEFEQCKFFGEIIKAHPDIICGNIYKRYELYNKFFYNRRNLNETTNN